MDVGAWLTAASADAERRGLPGLKPLLEALARSTTALREADRMARAAAAATAAPAAATTAPAAATATSFAATERDRA